MGFSWVGFVSMKSIQNFHQLAAAERNHLSGLDMLGLVAGDAVDVSVVRCPDLGDLLLFLLTHTLNVENCSLAFRGDVYAEGLQLLGSADAVAQLDPERLQLLSFCGMLRGEFYNVFVNTNFHNTFSLCS